MLSTNDNFLIKIKKKKLHNIQHSIHKRLDEEKERREIFPGGSFRWTAMQAMMPESVEYTICYTKGEKNIFPKFN